MLWSGEKTRRNAPPDLQAHFIDGLANLNGAHATALGWTEYVDVSVSRETENRLLPNEETKAYHKTGYIRGAGATHGQLFVLAFKR